MSKLISYYTDKQNRLFEITKEDGLIHIRLIPLNDNIQINWDELKTIDLDIIDLTDIP